MMVVQCTMWSVMSRVKNQNFNTIYVLKRTLSCQIKSRILHDESVRAD